MTIWIWFKNDNEFVIRDVEYYDATRMDGFIRVLKIGGKAKICIAESEVRMIGVLEEIFDEDRKREDG